MVCEIVRDPRILRKKSTEATAADLPVAADLMETLQANLDHCTALAASMIGKHKRIIAIAKGSFVIVMMNPKILSRSEAYMTEENCLCLDGTQEVKRYRSIRVSWQDMKMKEHVALLDGFMAQVVQHMVDHCNGMLI